MKFKFILAATLAALQASAQNWDALVAAAVEAGIATDAADLNAESLLQSITNADPSTEWSEKVRQLETRNSELQTRNSELETRIAELQKLPGATPAQPIATSDPPAPSANNEIGCLAGNESFIDSLDKVSEWL